MDCSVLCWVRCPDNGARVEEPCIPDRHAGFDAVLLGFDRGGDYAAVRTVVGRHDNWFAPEEGIGLLLYRAECRVEVSVQNSRRIVIDFQSHSLLNVCS